jgi:hypothetical protein
LPELALIEGNQRIATKPDEAFSPSLFTFRSYFAAIHHHYYYVFMTARTVTDSCVYRVVIESARPKARVVNGYRSRSVVLRALMILIPVG